ncbi:hypothetical protein [Peribacillus kribbensis]|uniref:hypothetical protein n=1 Tax=Peribacillus kribbensis TaxID=356658 RepID=UPI000424490A|nr:hypothetical protein [Peribacillus kribbensis]
MEGEELTLINLKNASGGANVSFENGKIKATMDGDSDGKFPLEDLAINTFSHLSDELLFYEGWVALTVTFTNVGTMSRNE